MVVKVLALTVDDQATNQIGREYLEEKEGAETTSDTQPTKHEICQRARQSKLKATRIKVCRKRGQTRIKESHMSKPTR